MVDLARWLGQQLDEDDRIARTLNPDPVASMARKFEIDALRLRSELKAGKSDRVPYDEGQADALHWAATVLPERMPALSPFGRDRVLREIDAKRYFLEVLAASMKPNATTGIPRGVAWSMLTRMAEPYRDRPGWLSYWPGSG